MCIGLKTQSVFDVIGSHLTEEGFSMGKLYKCSKTDNQMFSCWLQFTVYTLTGLKYSRKYQVFGETSSGSDRTVHFPDGILLSHITTHSHTSQIKTKNASHTIDLWNGLNNLIDILVAITSRIDVQSREKPVSGIVKSGFFPYGWKR